MTLLMVGTTFILLRCANFMSDTLYFLRQFIQIATKKINDYFRGNALFLVSLSFKSVTLVFENIICSQFESVATYAHSETNDQRGPFRTSTGVNSILNNEILFNSRACIF